MKSVNKTFMQLLLIFVVLTEVACSGGGGSGNGAGTGNTSSANDSAASNIGPAGGTLITPSGDVQANIPTGALSNSLNITIAPSTANTPQGNIGGVVDFGPEGTTFNSPVTISMKYDPALIPQEINESDLTLAFASDTDWTEIPTTVDTVNKILLGQTTHFSSYAPKISSSKTLAFGTPIGNPVNGVQVYSNGTVNTTGQYNTNNAQGYNTGMMWQCVEFVNRYYDQIYGTQIRIPGKNANDYYKGAVSRGLVPYPNGGTVLPQVGDIIVSEGTSLNVGHVAIVTAVNSTSIHMAEQNWHEGAGDLDHILNLKIVNGTYKVDAFAPSYPVTGWVRLPANSTDPTTPSTPGGVTVSPSSGSWTSSPQNLNVSASGATTIYYTMANTYDGSTPADPSVPTSIVNDGSINGASGTLQYYASSGQYKRTKLRFIGCNSTGCGAASGSFSYSIDLRTVPGGVTVSPSSGSWTSSPQNLNVSDSGATTIYYTMVNTYDGSTPADPSVPTSIVNDGSINGASGTLQYYASSGQYKRTKLRFIGCNSTGCGAASGSFSYSIDLRTVPGGVTVSPSSGSWTSSPQNLNVSDSGATTIYYTMVNTYDGSTPADPAVPTSIVNDGSINGASGTLQYYASSGQYKRTKLRFIGCNSTGCGAASGSFLYSIDLRTVPGSVTVSPSSGSWTSSPQNLNVSDSGATTIYYTMVNTYDGSTPADPAVPSSGANDGSISGASGTLQYYASSGQYKRTKLRFIGCNSTGCGAASGSFLYSIDLRTVPGSVTVSPSSGSWTSSPQNLNVSDSGATTIYYTMVNTYDGSTPADPAVPTSIVNDGSISGASGTFQYYASSGQYKRTKLRFIGCNSTGCGAASGSFLYSIDLRTVPGGVTVSPSSGSWTSSPQNLNVSDSGATTIYYTMVNTYDGSTPADPAAPNSSANDGSISGASGTFQYYASSGQYKRTKLRFIGCNSTGCGAASGSFLYSIDLR